MKSESGQGMVEYAIVLSMVAFPFILIGCCMLTILIPVVTGIIAYFVGG